MHELKQEFFRSIPNVRRFEDLMAGLARSPGEGRLACVYGRAGRGKTRTATWWYAQHAGCMYLRALAVWSTPRPLLQALCAELQVAWPSHRNAGLFGDAAAALRGLAAEAPGAAVFVDEIEKLSPVFLEVVRDLTDESGVPFVLIGEEGLYAHLCQRRRVWSRTQEVVEFGPLTADVIVVYAREAGDLEVSGEVASLLFAASEGDFRLIRRDLGALVRACAASKLDRPTPDLAKKIIRAGMRQGPAARGGGR